MPPIPPIVTDKVHAQVQLIRATEAYVAAIRRYGISAGLKFEQMAEWVSAVEEAELDCFICPANVDPEIVAETL